MSFNIFSDQIRMRQKNDAEVFSDAFSSLAAVLEEGFSKKTQKSEVTGAIAEVLASIGVVPAEVPEGIEDLKDQLQYMLRPSGVMHRRVELTGKWWKDASGSYLGSTKDGDVIAIKPGKLSGYEYKNRDGRTVKIHEGTAGEINIDAFCFYRPLPAKKITIADLATYMLRTISMEDILLVLGGSLLVSLVGMLTPILNQQLFKFVVPSGIRSNILPMAGILIGAAIGSTIFNITRSAITNRFMNKMDLSVQSAAMIRVFSLPATFFKDFSAGELSTRVMTINALCSALSNAVLSSGLTALFSFVYIFQMAQYGSALVVPGILAILANLVFSILTTFIQLNISRKLMKVSAKLSGMVYALFSGIQKIKLSGAEKRAFAKWAELYAQQSKLNYAPPIFLRIGSGISMLISLGGGLVIYYFAGLSRISAADYMAFNVAYGLVSGAIMSLGGITSTIAGIKPMLEMVEPIFNTVPETAGNKKIVKSLSGNIELNGLHFRYDKNSDWIINNLSLKVRSGEYVAIVGRTGCGKSTLLRLLLGFEKPETGAIYYDGQDLDSLDKNSVRRSIGVVLQNGKLFSGDIFSNIIVTAPDKTLDDAWEAARMAGLEGDIKAMPMGMHTMISEGGGGISGGQKQRLMIARAIVAKPKLLFFDEATSALDNVTQKHVADGIEKLKCTRIVIAHRLSTIRHANRIIVLDGGRIVEDGKYEDLMERRGVFYDMVKRQSV